MRPTAASFQSRPMHDSPSPRAQLPIQAMHTLLATGNLAVGPDATLGQDYQIPPLTDLDAIIDPLLAFLEVLDWEPENEVQSDDNDSQYNAIEEYSTGGEKGSLGSFSGDPECSSEDSEIDDTHKDALR